MSDDDLTRTLEGIRDSAARAVTKLKGGSSPLPGSYCIYCGDIVTGVNGTEECPVSRYMARVTLGGGGILELRRGTVHGSPHLWSAGHVEPWFNYSGPRGAEKGFPDGA